jgi:hypothetical protein
MHAPFNSFALLLCVIVVTIPTTMASPSTVPVGTDGYVYQQFYSASDCGGSKSFVLGYFANYCYSTGSYYRKYNFTKGR